MLDFDDIMTALEDAKSLSFRSAEICFWDVVQSLDDDEPLIDVKPSGGNLQCWTTYNTSNNSVALLSYAGIWQWGSDPYTGNYVPPGEQAPRGLVDRNIQNSVSLRCEFSYCLDTEHDDSIYNLIQRMEEFVQTKQDFNKSRRDRRTYQDGSLPENRKRYVLNAKVFARKTTTNENDLRLLDNNLPYPLVPWIKKALKDSPGYMQNLDRPKYLDYVNGKAFVDVTHTNKPYYGRGDLVWFTFKLCFNVLGNSWFPEIVPVEFVRLAEGPEEEAPRIDYSAYPELDQSVVGLEAGAVMQPINRAGINRFGKRPIKTIGSDGSGDESDLQSNKKARDTQEDVDMGETEVDHKEVYTQKGRKGRRRY